MAGPLIGALLILLVDAPFALVNVLAGLVYAVAMPFVGIATTYVYYDTLARERLGEREPAPRSFPPRSPRPDCPACLRTWRRMDGPKQRHRLHHRLSWQRRMGRAVANRRIFPYLVGVTVALSLLAGFLVTLVDKQDFPSVRRSPCGGRSDALARVGYGDVVPHTAWGRFVGSVVIVHRRDVPRLPDGDRHVALRLHGPGRGAEERTAATTDRAARRQWPPCVESSSAWPESRPSSASSQGGLASELTTSQWFTPSRGSCMVAATER